MTRRQLGVCVLAGGLALGMWREASAQQPPGSAKLQRPPAADLKIAPLSPQMEQLLKTWELHSARIRTLSGKHDRTEFNHVFQVEKRSEGQFFYQAPDKGRIDMKGAKIRPGEKSTKKGKDGEEYRLQAGHEERWICTGNEVLQINEQAREFEVIPLPPEYRGANIIRSPLPFLFGLKAEDAKRRFDFKLLAEKPDYYVLEVVPRTNQDAFQKAYVQLDKQRFIPTAVILYDTSGGLETKYVFKDININDSGFSGWLRSTFGGDPFQPNLQGYRRVQPPAVEPAANSAAPGARAPVQSAVQKSTVPSATPPNRGLSSPAPARSSSR